MTPRPAEELPVPGQPNADVNVHHGRAGDGQTRRDRLLNWLQWAAAPLGFSVFLVTLMLFGLLKDESTTDPGRAPAANPPAAGSTATPSVATTVPEASTTTAAPTTEPPPPPETRPVSPSTGRSTSGRFEPVCGYLPGQTVHIRINGQPAPPETANADGCVTVNR